MVIPESFGTALRPYRITNVETAEPVGIEELDIPSSSNTDFIPDWCKKLYNEKQKDPDKDPGFEVHIKMWSTRGDMILEGAFMYTGQDSEQLKGTAVDNGTVGRGEALIKGSSHTVQHDLWGRIIMKGDEWSLNVHNLKRSLG